MKSFFFNKKFSLTPKLGTEITELTFLDSTNILLVYNDTFNVEEWKMDFLYPTSHIYLKLGRREFVVQNIIDQKIYLKDMSNEFIMQIDTSSKYQLNDIKGFWMKDINHKSYTEKIPPPPPPPCRDTIVTRYPSIEIGDEIINIQTYCSDISSKHNFKEKFDYIMYTDFGNKYMKWKIIDVENDTMILLINSYCLTCELNFSISPNWKSEKMIRTEK